MKSSFVVLFVIVATKCLPFKIQM